MSSDVTTCPSCGARIDPGAERCDLCGTPHSSDTGAAADESIDASAADGTANLDDEVSDPANRPSTKDAPPVYCNQCGWKNPGGAQYCSRCGRELQDLSTEISDTSDAATSDAAASATPVGTRAVDADLPAGPDADSVEHKTGDGESPPAREVDDQAAVGQRITLIVGVAVLAVIGLFFGTRWSQQVDWGKSPEAGDSAPSAPSGEERAGGPARSAPPGEARGRARAEPVALQTLVDSLGQPLSGALAAQADSLQVLADGASGAREQEVRAELANLLIGAGAPGRAALQQQKVADATGTVEDRRRAADLLYKWMRQLEGQGNRRQVPKVARHVAQAYGAVVDQRPQDLDAKTRMGEAYLLTNNPMKGIRAINAVVDTDSTFVPARFQKGLALLQINRLGEALTEFRAAERHAEPGSPFQKQARRAIDVIQEQMGSGNNDGSARP